MIQEEHKAEFNKLIDMYYAHNSEVMAEYNNPMESFNKVISSIQSSQPQQIFSKPVGEYQYTVMLGGIDKTVAEKKQYQNGMAALFEKLRTDGDMTIQWDEIKEKYLDYSTNGSANNAFRNYVSNQSQYLFNHMEKTWNQLLNKESFKDILAKSVIELTGQTQSDFHSRFIALNSKSKEEGGAVDFVENALTVYAQMYDEIKKGYADGTREVWIADKSAENEYRKATEAEEIAVLDKAMEFHAMVVDGYLNYGVQAGLDAQEAMERTRTMLENKEYVARLQREKEEGTERIYRSRWKQ